MSNVELSITIGVYADPDYHYEVNVGDSQLDITYKEGDNTRTHVMSFGSREEMRAVAHAMIKALDVDLNVNPTDN